VLSQAQVFDPANPTDAQFVENVMWEESRVVFATINMPGSNNDGLTWTAPFTDETARAREAAQRFKQAVQSDSSDGDAWYGLGLAWERLGERAAGGRLSGHSGSAGR